MIDETNNSLDSLPFNPAKMLTASLNIANSARLHTSGVAKLGIGIAADGFITLSPVGNVSLAGGNITLSTLMLIYHQEYQSLEGILMGHFLREWLIQMLVIKMIVINIQKV
ncbi:hypothetical protein O6V16_15290 [Salmonella enterica subsp. enterica]|uniref:hypothetical protein n=1 Tax=Salmonella enterica TaxID=28901 RepID=UPI0017814EBF|nr:hypothetical protein [Salmonella enterica]MBD8280096.1 hypothetical protein [Salmonella enterica subsp. enterica serovar Gallinarum]